MQIRFDLINFSKFKEKLFFNVLKTAKNGHLLYINRCFHE